MSTVQPSKLSVLAHVLCAKRSALCKVGLNRCWSDEQRDEGRMKG